MARNDAHSPTNLITEDYSYLYAADTGGPWAVQLDRDFLRELTNFGPTDPHPTVNQCTHCGAHLRYVAFLRHDPTGYTITVGETCLENRFERATADFQRLRKQAELDREAHRIVNAYNEWLRTLPRNAFLLLCSDADFEVAATEAKPEAAAYVRLYRTARADDFVADVRRRCRQYGSGSERQVAAVVKVPQRIQARNDRDAAEANEVTVPVITGKVRVEGEVLTVKWQDSQYGGAYKMLVKVATATPTGPASYKVWGTVPSSCSSVRRGDTIRFTATFERSRDDEAFGFFKRPTQATYSKAPENPYNPYNPYEA